MKTLRLFNKTLTVQEETILRTVSCLALLCAVTLSLQAQTKPPWTREEVMKQAADNVEKYRKSDAVIRLSDENGNPLADRRGWAHRRAGRCVASGGRHPGSEWLKSVHGCMDAPVWKR